MKQTDEFIWGSLHYFVYFCIFENFYKIFSFTCMHSSTVAMKEKNVFLNIRKVLTYQYKFINSPQGYTYTMVLLGLQHGCFRAMPEIKLLNSF